MFIYPYLVRQASDAFMISFPDVPEALTYSETEAEIPQRAHDALWTALDVYVRQRRPLPTPSKGAQVVDLGPLVGIKLELHHAMVMQGVTKAELARRLDVAPTQADRLLDFDHKSRLEQIVDALEAVDRRIQVYVERMPAPPGRQPGEPLPVPKRTRGTRTSGPATFDQLRGMRRKEKRASR